MPLAKYYNILTYIFPYFSFYVS